jgi:UDP-galactose-lipid carrier transferase
MIGAATPRVNAVSSGSRHVRRVARFVAHWLFDTLVFALAWGVIQHLEVAATGQPQMLGTTFWLSYLVWFVWQAILKGHYTHKGPFWQDLRFQLKGLGWLATGHTGLAVLGHWVLSPWSLLMGWAVVMVGVPVGRALARQVLAMLRLWYSPTLVFGTGQNAEDAARALSGEVAMGFYVVGFVSVQLPSGLSTSVPKTTWAGKPLLIWDGSHETLDLANSCHCVIALEADQGLLRDEVIRALTNKHVSDVHVIPAMRGVPLYGMDVSHFFSREVLMIHVGNNLASGVFAAYKRTFDLVVSGLLLLLLAPLLGYLAYKVRQDGGPALFGHSRIGRNGKTFKCLKFRSMVVDAKERLAHLLATDPQARAEWDKDFKLRNDPRISAVGHFLRKTSLDELPQLWNVFKGEMSLVGPRPVIRDELERYGNDVSYYLQVRPGVTGLWQVSGRNDVDYATRVYLDAWYVKNWTLWNDIAILFKTVGVVTKTSGAY